MNFSASQLEIIAILVMTQIAVAMTFWAMGYQHGWSTAAKSMATARQGADMEVSP